MATSGENENSLNLDSLEADLKTAKRDLVLKFVKDQEALQTSLADLKVVGDQTLDLIDATMVVKDEECVGINHNHTQAPRGSGHHLSHASDLYSPQVSYERTEEEENCEPVLVPRPPSGRPRTNSRSRKQSRDYRDRKMSKEMRGSSFHGHLPERLSDQLARHEDNAATSQQQDSSGSDCDLDSRALNSSWPQQLMSKKVFGSLRKHSVYGCDEENVQEYPVDLDEWKGDMRPKSSGHNLRHIPLGADMAVTARISSASDSDRISCKIGTLIRPGSSGGLLTKSPKRKTFINFGLDPSLSFDGALELEPVHPSEIPMFRSTSASSSGRSYALMQLPPIVKEAPTH